jgi:hypothetical protein
MSIIEQERKKMMKETYTVVVRDAWGVELDRVTRDTDQAAYNDAFDRWDGGDYPLNYTLETEGERINWI